MSLKKKITVRYLGRDFQKSSKEVTALTMYAVNVEGTATKIYHDCFPLLLNLKKNELTFLLFLVTVMDEENQVHNDKKTRDFFNQMAKKRELRAYTDRTIHRWFQNLSNTELLTKRKERSLYQLNPIYFSYQVDKSGGIRDKLIRTKLEAPLRWEIARHRAIHLSGTDQSENERGSSQLDA